MIRETICPNLIEILSPVPHQQSMIIFFIVLFALSYQDQQQNPVPAPIQLGNLHPIQQNNV